MSSIFRPWVTPSKGLDFKSTPPDFPVIDPQDSTVSTTSPTERTTTPEDYKHVKENIRRRSEKYLKRRLRKSQSQTSKSVESVEVEKVKLPVEETSSATAHFPPNYFLPSFCPVPLSDPTTTGVCPNFSDYLYNPSWCDFGLKSPELIETALAQGISPSLVEEYAQMLTQQQKQVADRNRKQRPKKFRCPHCQVAFSNNGQLKGHIRIHTGERPFKCDLESCGKSFTRNEELTRHRRIHSGLRPFPCSECGKRFGRKDHLKKHIRTHFQQRYQLVPIVSTHYQYLLQY